MVTNREVLLGRLWIWFTILGLGFPALVLLLIGIFVPALATGRDSLAVGGVLFAVAMFLGILAIPGIVVGRGLAKGKTWAKIPALVLSVLILAHFPIGTALAIFTFIVVFEGGPNFLP